jgi:hypothetical protein
VWFRTAVDLVALFVDLLDPGGDFRVQMHHARGQRLFDLFDRAEGHALARHALTRIRVM